MLKRLAVQNFRSIEDATVDFAPITILYGPTAAGKSTLLYATLVLRNFALNPNQALDAMFNLGFQNLSGFEACVFDHDPTKELGIAATFDSEQGTGTFGVRFSKGGAEISLSTDGVATKTSLATGKVAVPYGLSPPITLTFVDHDDSYTVTWNGITSSVSPDEPTAATQAEATRIATGLNMPVESLRRMDIAPHRRGFFKPTYAVVPISALPTTEDEVASLLIHDMNIAPKVSASTEEIFGRDFRPYTAPGTAMTYFQSTDKKTRMPVLLVNDGFGVNQVVYILAKIHRVDVDTILIEEPEVHLHPTVIREFARVLCTLAREDKKQVIVATHSEQFLISVLNCVRDGLVSSKDVKCYMATRPKKATVFQEQKVAANGQIEGGLSAFVEAETADLKAFATSQG